MRFGKKSIIVSAAVMAIGTAAFVSAKVPEGVEAPKDGELPEKPANDMQQPEMNDGQAPEKPADDKQPQNNGRTPEDGGQPPR